MTIGIICSEAVFAVCLQVRKVGKCVCVCVCNGTVFVCLVSRRNQRCGGGTLWASTENSANCQLVIHSTIRLDTLLCCCRVGVVMCSSVNATAADGG